MKKNMSSIDRVIRVALAVLVAILIITNILNGTWAIILGIVGGILLVTGLIGVCPLYALLKLSTNKKS